MKISIKSIEPAVKAHRLADVSVELTDADGDSLVISDIRVLENKQGQIWVAMPTRSVSTGRLYRYLPQVELNRPLKNKVEDAVLAAFDDWKSRSKVEVR